MRKPTMGILVPSMLVALLALSANAQVCDLDVFADINAQIIRAAASYFARRASVVASGFGTIDVELSWTEEGLFRTFYGEIASTASFIAAIKDMKDFSFRNATRNEIIQLIRLGLFKDARSRFAGRAIAELERLGLVQNGFACEGRSEEIQEWLREQFDSLRDALEIDFFASFLNLRLGRSLSFVMDTTGSMSGEIGAAKARVAEIINTTRNSVNAPLNYVLVPYNDPGLGPVTKTRDPDVFNAALNDLRASGGGDFPELAMGGLLLAAQNSGHRSIVYLFTDATAKDIWEQTQVLAWCLARKISVTFFLTNDLAKRKKRELKQSRALYNDVAGKTGGLVLVVDKSDIKSATSLMQETSAPGRVQLFSVAQTNSRNISVFVDCTVSELTVLLSGDFNYETFHSLNKENVTVTPISEISGMRLFRLSNVQPGEYTFQFERGDEFGVSITGQSVLGFHACLSQKKRGTDEYVSSRQLVAGVVTIAEFTIYGDIGEGYFNRFTLISRSGKELYRQDLLPCSSDCRNIHANLSFTLPSEPMFAMLIGYDEKGNRMQRIDPCAITPVNTSSYLEDIRGLTVDPGSTITVRVRFWNLGIGDQFQFEVSDDKRFTSGLAISRNVASGSVQEESLTISVPSGALGGVLSTAIVTVRAEEGDYYVSTSFIITVADDTIRCTSLSTPRGGELQCNPDGVSVGARCELICGPEYEMLGRGYANCQSNGTWDVDSPGECNFLGSNSCTAYGDPHYVSFDGRRYDFMGSCIYLMSETTEGIPDDLTPFRISAENRPTFWNPRVSAFWNGFVTVYNTTVFFKQGGTVLVNGLRVNLPASLEGGKIQLTAAGINVLLTTDFKLQVLTNKRHAFQIKLPGRYTGHVRGLCGNYNKNPADDLTFNGTVSSSATDFAQRFEVAGGEAEHGCRKGEPSDEDNPCTSPAAQAKAEEQCAYLIGECFEKCGLNETKQSSFEECVYDICANYSTFGFEEAVKTLARQCNAEGFEVCRWREDLDLPQPCPENSHYEHDANPCANTCVDKRYSERCLHMPTEEACVCDEGFYASDTKCVPESQCGCATEGRYYLNEERFITAECEQLCVCRNNEIECNDYACGEGTECRKDAGKYKCLPKQLDLCQAIGDPHYRTLDGTSFDFMGACRYLMFDTIGEDLAPAKRIRVEAQNENRGSTRVSYVKLITIMAGNHTFTLGPMKMERSETNEPPVDVLVDAKNVLLKMEDTYNPPETNYVLRWTGSYATFTTIDGIRVQFDGTNFFMDIPSKYMGKVTGMCGNYTGATEDDFGGHSIEEFAEMNLLPGDCIDTGDPFVCPADRRALYSGMDYCGVLTNGTGPFARCHDFVPVHTFFENCVFDTCESGGDNDAYVSSINSYLETCKRKGVKICNWRIASLIPTCPMNSYWDECAPTCIQTCQDPLAESCDIDDTETTGRCVCSLGYVMLNGRCIEPSKCGCTIDGVYVDQDTEIMKGECLYSLTCVGANDVSRTDDPCDEESTCRSEGGIYACVPNELPHALVYGDPHHITFDGRYLYIAGDCVYCLVEHTVEGGVRDVPFFRVDIINERTSVAGRARLKGVLIRIMLKKMVSIRLGEDIPVMIDDRAFATGRVMDGFTIKRTLGNLALVFDFGMEIHYNMRDWLRVDLDRKFMGKVKGIAGNFNDDPSDDLTYAGELYAVERWVDLWLVADLSPKTCTVVTPPTVDPCLKTGFRSRFERSCDCGVITDIDGPFAVCHAKLQPKPFFDSCVFDACSHDGSPIAIARVIEAYAKACRGKGIRPGPWRDVVELPDECPENSHYEFCASGCPPTCGMPEGTICTSVCWEGCTCDEGFVLSNGKCVSKDQCGCMKGTTYYEHGTCLSNTNCTEECTCLNGEWECEPTRCYDNQYCGLREGVFGCQWIDQCKYDNGGCSDKCMWNNGSVVCSCPSGMVLGKDDVTCVEISSTYLMEGGGICGQTFSIWRKEFLQWKNEYLPEWTKELESYKAIASGRMMLSGASMCNVTWTQWFDTDDPQGCGDDESLERIRAEHPGLCCVKALAIEARIVGTKGPIVPAGLTYDANPDKGLLCKNAKQAAGERCPDFEVRFLCEQM